MRAERAREKRAAGRETLPPSTWGPFKPLVRTWAVSISKININSN